VRWFSQRVLCCWCRIIIAELITLISFKTNEDFVTLASHAPFAFKLFSKYSSDKPFKPLVIAHRRRSFVWTIRNSLLDFDLSTLDSSNFLETSLPSFQNYLYNNVLLSTAHSRVHETSLQFLTRTDTLFLIISQKRILLVKTKQMMSLGGSFVKFNFFSLKLIRFFNWIWYYILFHTKTYFIIKSQKTAETKIQVIYNL